jgi:signal transduction histidine kinase
MRAMRERLARVNRERIDMLVALALLIEIELECLFDGTVRDSRLPVTMVAAALVIAPVAVRRRRPAAALLFASAVMTIQALLGNGLGASSGVSMMLALALLAYGTGAWLDLRHGLRALVLGAVAFSGFIFLSEPSASSAVGSELFALAVVFAAPWFVGRVARERGRRAAAFRELAAQAAIEHERHERAAIAQERERIGGELQDIIAHSVSAMVIQAGGARRLLRSDPARARDSILTVERTGREALADMRRLLGMLRKDEDQRALAPQPGLDQLASLLDSMRQAGLACELRTEGEPVDLTPGLDLVGYRVIEAALLNAASHHSSHSVVTVRYGGERLELDIRGDGRMPELERELRSMSERLALYDGSLRAMPTVGDGFALQARLPLAGPPATAAPATVQA